MHPLRGCQIVFCINFLARLEIRSSRKVCGAQEETIVVWLSVESAHLSIYVAIVRWIVLSMLLSRHQRKSQAQILF